MGRGHEKSGEKCRSFEHKPTGKIKKRHQLFQIGTIGNHSENTLCTGTQKTAKPESIKNKIYGNEENAIKV